MATALTYVAFPWMLLPGLAVDLPLRIVMALLPDITAYVPILPPALTFLLLRLTAVHFLLAPIVNGVLSAVPISRFSGGLCQSLKLHRNTSPLLGSAGIELVLDSQCVHQLLMAVPAYALNVWDFKFVRVVVTLSMPPLIPFARVVLAVEDIQICGGIHDWHACTPLGKDGKRRQEMAADPTIHTNYPLREELSYRWPMEIQLSNFLVSVYPLNYQGDAHVEAIRVYAVGLIDHIESYAPQFAIFLRQLLTGEPTAMGTEPQPIHIGLSEMRWEVAETVDKSSVVLQMHGLCIKLGFCADGVLMPASALCPLPRGTKFTVGMELDDVKIYTTSGCARCEDCSKYEAVFGFVDEDPNPVAKWCCSCKQKHQKGSGLEPTDLRLQFTDRPWPGSLGDSDGRVSHDNVADCLDSLKKNGSGELRVVSSSRPKSINPNNLVVWTGNSIHAPEADGPAKLLDIWVASRGSTLMLTGAVSKMNFRTNLKALQLLQRGLAAPPMPPRFCTELDKYLWDIYHHESDDTTETALGQVGRGNIAATLKKEAAKEDSLKALYIAATLALEATHEDSLKAAQGLDDILSRLREHPEGMITVAELLLEFRSVEERVKDEFADDLNDGKIDIGTIISRLRSPTSLRYLLDRSPLNKTQPGWSWCDEITNYGAGFRLEDKTAGTKDRMVTVDAQVSDTIEVIRAQIAATVDIERKSLNVIVAGQRLYGREGLVSAVRTALLAAAEESQCKATDATPSQAQAAVLSAVQSALKYELQAVQSPAFLRLVFRLEYADMNFTSALLVSCHTMQQTQSASEPGIKVDGTTYPYTLCAGDTIMGRCSYSKANTVLSRSWPPGFLQQQGPPQDGPYAIAGHQINFDEILTEISDGAGRYGAVSKVSQAIDVRMEVGGLPAAIQPVIGGADQQFSCGLLRIEGLLATDTVGTLKDKIEEQSELLRATQTLFAYGDENQNMQDEDELSVYGDGWYANMPVQVTLIQATPESEADVIDMLHQTINAASIINVDFAISMPRLHLSAAYTNRSSASQSVCVLDCGKIVIKLQGDNEIFPTLKKLQSVPARAEYNSEDALSYMTAFEESLYTSAEICLSGAKLFLYKSSEMVLAELDQNGDGLTSAELTAALIATGRFAESATSLMTVLPDFEKYMDQELDSDISCGQLDRCLAENAGVARDLLCMSPILETWGFTVVCQAMYITERLLKDVVSTGRNQLSHPDLDLAKLPLTRAFVRFDPLCLSVNLEDVPVLTSITNILGEDSVSMAEDFPGADISGPSAVPTAPSCETQDVQEHVSDNALTSLQVRFGTPIWRPGHRIVRRVVTRTQEQNRTWILRQMCAHAQQTDGTQSSDSLVPEDKAFSLIVKVLRAQRASLVFCTSVYPQLNRKAFGVTRLRGTVLARCAYNNVALGFWEPFMDDWEFDYNHVAKAATYSPSYVYVPESDRTEISSTLNLNFNISHGSLRMLLELSAMGSKLQQPEQTRRQDGRSSLSAALESGHGFRIWNDTGEMLFFQFFEERKRFTPGVSAGNEVQHGFTPISERNSMNDNDILPLNDKCISSVCEGTQYCNNVLVISVGAVPCDNISLEQWMENGQTSGLPPSVYVIPTVRTACTTLLNPQNGLICRVHNERNGTKTVAVSSGILMRNETDVALIFSYTDSQSGKDISEVTLGAHDLDHVPVAALLKNTTSKLSCKCTCCVCHKRSEPCDCRFSTVEIELNSWDATCVHASHEHFQNSSCSDTMQFRSVTFADQRGGKLVHCHMDWSTMDDSSMQVDNKNPKMVLTFRPFFEFTNALPFDIKLSFDPNENLRGGDTDNASAVTVQLSPGEEFQLPCCVIQKNETRVQTFVKLDAVDIFGADIYSKAKELYRRIDDDTNGTLTKDEIEAALDKTKSSSYLEQLDRLEMLVFGTDGTTHPLLDGIGSSGLEENDFVDLFRLADKASTQNLKIVSTIVYDSALVLDFSGRLSTQLRHNNDLKGAMCCAAPQSSGRGRNKTIGGINELLQKAWETGILHETGNGESPSIIKLPLVRHTRSSGAEHEKCLSLEYSYDHTRQKMQMCIFASHWVVNHTWLWLQCIPGDEESQFKQHATDIFPSAGINAYEMSSPGGHQPSQYKADDSSGIYEGLTRMQTFGVQLFGMGEARTLRLQLHDDGWVYEQPDDDMSDSIDVVGTSRMYPPSPVVVALMHSKFGGPLVKNIKITVETAPAPFVRTRIVTISPTWTVNNLSSHDLKLSSRAGPYRALRDYTHPGESSPVIERGQVLHPIYVERDSSSHEVVHFLSSGSSGPARMLACPCRIGKTVLLRNIDLHQLGSFLAKGLTPVKSLVGKKGKELSVLEAGEEVEALEFTNHNKWGIYAKVITMENSNAHPGWVPISSLQEIFHDGASGAGKIVHDQMQDVVGQKVRSGQQAPLLSEKGIGSFTKRDSACKFRMAITEMDSPTVFPLSAMDTIHPDQLEYHFKISSGKQKHKAKHREDKHGDMWVRATIQGLCTIGKHNCGTVVLQNADKAQFRIQNDSDVKFHWFVEPSRGPLSRWRSVKPGAMVEIWDVSTWVQNTGEGRKYSNPMAFILTDTEFMQDEKRSQSELAHSGDLTDQDNTLRRQRTFRLDELRGHSPIHYVSTAGEACSLDVMTLIIAGVSTLRISIGDRPKVVAPQSGKSEIDIRLLGLEVSWFHQPAPEAEKKKGDKEHDAKGKENETPTDKQKEWFRFVVEDCIYTNSSTGMLHVTVVRADIPGDSATFVGKDDPYCVLAIGGQTKRTDAIEDGGQHPRWIAEIDEHSPYNILSYRYKFAATLTDFLEIKVYHSDSEQGDSTKDDEIGFCKINLAEVLMQPQRSRGHLHIKICEARGLPKTDIFGWCDPYATVEIDGLRVETHRIDETANPKWMLNPELCYFKFKIHDGTNPAVLISVWDYDSTSSNDLLGQFTVSLEELIDLAATGSNNVKDWNPKLQVAHGWYPLRAAAGGEKMKGKPPEVKIEFAFRPTLTGGQSETGPLLEHVTDGVEGFQLMRRDQTSAATGAIFVIIGYENDPKCQPRVENYRVANIGVHSQEEERPCRSPTFELNKGVHMTDARCAATDDGISLTADDPPRILGQNYKLPQLTAMVDSYFLRNFCRAVYDLIPYLDNLSEDTAQSYVVVEGLQRLAAASSQGASGAPTGGTVWFCNQPKVIQVQACQLHIGTNIQDLINSAKPGSKRFDHKVHGLFKKYGVDAAIGVADGHTEGTKAWLIAKFGSINLETKIKAMKYPIRTPMPTAEDRSADIYTLLYSQSLSLAADVLTCVFKSSPVPEELPVLSPPRLDSKTGRPLRGHPPSCGPPRDFGAFIPPAHMIYIVNLL
jgi:hypothetical protein